MRYFHCFLPNLTLSHSCPLNPFETCHISQRLRQDYLSLQTQSSSFHSLTLATWDDFEWSLSLVAHPGSTAAHFEIWHYFDRHTLPIFDSAQQLDVAFWTAWETFKAVSVVG